MEQNWGTALPESYVWTQCSGFGQDDSCVIASVEEVILGWASAQRGMQHLLSGQRISHGYQPRCESPAMERSRIVDSAGGIPLLCQSPR